MRLSSLGQSRGLADLVTVGRITSFGLSGEDSNPSQVSGQFEASSKWQSCWAYERDGGTSLLHADSNIPTPAPLVVPGTPPHSTYKPGSAGETGDPLGSPLPHCPRRGSSLVFGRLCKYFPGSIKNVLTKPWAKYRTSKPELSFWKPFRGTSLWEP